jgi:hypothetical protein
MRNRKSVEVHLVDGKRQTDVDNHEKYSYVIVKYGRETHIGM